MLDQRDRPQHLFPPARRHPEHPAEVAEILADGEVVVHGGSLGRVGDTSAKPAGAGGQPQNAHLPVLDPLHADERAHERRLAAAARAEQARDASGRDREREVVEHA